MAAEPESKPGLLGTPPRLQLEDHELFEAWCREANATELADSVDRLSGDVDLVTDMALEGYVGPVWEHFANELTKYALAVFRSWLATGSIYRHCADKGRPVKRLHRDFTDDEVEGLADETVAEALYRFRTTVLMTNKWDSRRGATLRTFFIGQCLLRFPNIYSTFRRDVIRNGHEPTDDLRPLMDLRNMSPGPERHVVPHLTSMAALESVKSPKVRRAMIMRADGWSNADIAEEFGTTEKGVERMLANERQRLRGRGIA
ncbi:MAG: Fis family transcriptional regulator [Marmoricola sp.]